jgi:hypothetical protein
MALIETPRSSSIAGVESTSITANDPTLEAAALTHLTQMRKEAAEFPAYVPPSPAPETPMPGGEPAHD